MARLRIAIDRPAILALLIALIPHAATAQEPKLDAANVGQFFTVAEPIDHDSLLALREAAIPYLQRFSGEGKRPILVLEFRANDARPGDTPFGAANDLAEFIVNELRGANKVVAFVPESLSGYALLPVLACDEIVLGTNASIGPITPPGGQVTPARRQTVRDLAQAKGRDAELLLGMLEPDADLRVVQTGDRQVHYVFAEKLEEFRKTHEVTADEPAWEGGRRGVLSAERARSRFVRLLADNRNELARRYDLPTISDDPTLSGPITPLVIRIEGRIDSIKESYLARRVEQARGEKVNLIIFEINSEGGLLEPADKVARIIADLKGIKTVAYVADRALGVASLIPLACDEIAFQSKARMGDLSSQLPGDGDTRPIESEMLDVAADAAQALAQKKGHPGAVARAMVDPSAIVHQARDNDTGSVVFVLDTELKAAPNRYRILETPKSQDGVLTLDDQTAKALGMSARTVKDFEDLRVQLGLRNKNLKRDAPTWVDSLVTTLNTPWMKGLLLFIGLFMLVVELKLPGVGLPAIVGALAFLLYFWSSYLGGTADQLEILLFLVGLICVALELFVFPGYGVFGLSGVLLVLASVVMASHTFVWPTQDYEYRQMGMTLLRVLLVIIGVIVGAMTFGRFFPSMPFFNRMVLKAVPFEPDESAAGRSFVDDAPSYHYLLGETGRTTTVLKPIGRARFGDLLLEVTADGYFISSDRLVEVVEVRGMRIVVKEVV